MKKILIALEGLPGGGKTTLAKLLAEYFRGLYIPEIIYSKKYRPDEDLFYVQSELEKVKLYEKSRKKFCFIDRNHLSMLAYNFGKSHNALDNIYKKLISKFEHMPEPDLYIYLKIDNIELCNKRKGVENRNPVWVNEKILKSIKSFYDKAFQSKNNVYCISVEENDLKNTFMLIVDHIQTKYGK